MSRVWGASLAIERMNILKSAVTIEQTNPGLWMMLACDMAEAGDYKGAIEACHKIYNLRFGRSIPGDSEENKLYNLVEQSYTGYHLWYIWGGTIW